MAKNAKNDIQHLEESVPSTPPQTELEALDSIELTKASRFSWLVSFTAAIGGMLFGYDTGIISVVLLYLGTDLGHVLSSSEKELITSITSGGAFLGAVFAGSTADFYGRKVAIYVGCILFIVGAILQAPHLDRPR